MPVMRRKFTGPIQFFHYYDHGALAHCVGSREDPYIICHIAGRHIIDKEYAIGHGKGRSPQMFIFTEKALCGKFFLSSGKKIDTK